MERKGCISNRSKIEVRILGFEISGSCIRDLPLGTVWMEELCTLLHEKLLHCIRHLFVPYVVGMYHNSCVDCVFVYVQMVHFKRPTLSGTRNLLMSTSHHPGYATRRVSWHVELLS